MTPGAETADLAALLMEWKTRSKLSYGVLAQRLHLSASTLHRYCRGEALPPEFAIVERFARVCRATPEEQSEAHRRWIAADLARQRDRKGPRPAEPEAPTRPVAAPSAGTADPLPEPEPAAAPAEPAAPRRPRPPLPWIAGGALAAGLAAVLLAVLLPEGEGGAEKDYVRNPVTGTAPLNVTTRPFAFENCDGALYLVDRPPAEVPPPPDEGKAHGWVRALGAVVADRQLMEFTIQGSGDSTVVLNDLRVNVTETGDPLPWELYGGYAGCGGGPVRTTDFTLDLDAGAPELVADPDQDDLPLSVDENEPVVFYLDARTESRDVTWHLELDWSSGDESGTLRVDDEGRSFRTSASSGQTEWGYMIGGTEWFDVDNPAGG
ncbi:Helix-turn-helix domain-containing protein [Streptomyces zhaozhouensis]|uniref:Helix-turn-helix domain-containing protein n=1 Tax=Streptomyces zhaozhouensis TaxID=1300267 RepID=A0A286DX59_9ACTN|nr:helix-turn-helix transcriptional regulator [Streptomyces zhaozhouensis]SOD63223.1 Helix-turn-helix domain-containing protein [Streptomyces zhaozhouensis]